MSHKMDIQIMLILVPPTRIIPPWLSWETFEKIFLKKKPTKQNKTNNICFIFSVSYMSHKHYKNILL